ncbi:MAG: YfhO family protein [Clostridia bacterium]|nr:YfhO family protein [Clostridia bacterium]
MEKALKADKNGGKKLNSCFKVRHLILLSAIVSLIIFALHFFMLYYHDVWPFGTRVPSQYDLLAQIVPFAEHFFDVLNGEASIFYSYRVGGGMDVFGTVAYCLVSPFTFLFWIFGDGNVWQAASVIIPAKLCCIAISALVMIKLCFPRMNKVIALALSLVYAFCGYVFVSNTYINWMDFLIYLPLAVPAFGKMVREGKIFWFSVIIACCIYTCFSITCFSMFVSYPALVSYAFLAVEKGDRKRYLAKLSLSFVCGVVAALPLMVPAFMSYVSSGRNTGLFDSLFDDISAISYGRKFSYILGDTLFLLLAIVYFIKTKFRTKESRFAAVAGAMIMMPVVVDECCILMNMGSYMSYALRFGFLNALYGLVISCRVLEDFSFKRKPRNFEKKLDSCRTIKDFPAADMEITEPASEPVAEAVAEEQTAELSAGGIKIFYIYSKNGYWLVKSAAGVKTFKSNAIAIKYTRRAAKKRPVMVYTQKNDGRFALEILHCKEEERPSAENLAAEEAAPAAALTPAAVPVASVPAIREKPRRTPELRDVPNKKAVKSGGLKAVFMNKTLPFSASALFILLAMIGGLVIYCMASEYWSLASSYAHSTGAIELISQVFAIVFAIAALGVLLYVCRIAPSKAVFVGMAIILAVQLAMYDGMLVSGNVFNHVRYDQYDTLYSQVMEDEELEPYEFRVKDYANSLSDNQSFITNSASYSAFSSMTSSDNFAFNEVFGMGGNGVNTIKSRDGNLLGNCLIGNKYYFYSSEGTDSSRTRLTCACLGGVGGDTYFIMYKNTLVYPSAFTVSDGDMQVTADYDCYFDNMQNIYEFLGGEGSVFDEYAFTDNDVVEALVDDGEGGKVTVFQVKFRRYASGDISFCANFPEDMNVQWYSGTYATATKYDASEVKTFTYSNQSSTVYYYFYVTGDGLTKEDILNYCSLKILTKDTVAELGESLWQRQVKYTMTSSLLKTTISTNVTAEQEGQYLFINYVALDGHTAYVNGKEVELADNGLNMLLVPLEKGENEVVIEYSSPSVKQMAAGAAAAVVLLGLIAAFFCGKKGKLRFEKVKTPVAALSVILAAAVVAFFMIFPAAVFAVKLVKLIFL